GPDGAASFTIGVPAQAPLGIDVFVQAAETGAQPGVSPTDSTRVLGVYAGDYDVVDQASLDALQDQAEITGSLSLRIAPGVVQLPWLQAVGQDLDLPTGATTTVFSAPALTHIGRSFSVFLATSLSAVSLPALTSVTDVHVTGASALAWLDLSALDSITDGVAIQTSPNVVWSAPLLATIGTTLDVRNLGSLSLPALQSVGGSVNVQNDTQVDLPVLDSVGGPFSVQGAGASTLAAPSLRTIGGNLSCNLTHLSTLALPALTDVQAITIGSNALLTQLDFGSLQSAVGATVSANPQLPDCVIEAELGAFLTVGSCQNNLADACTPYPGGCL
ncbi:MAG: hypothetical protein KC621_19755, partial [Myxococcales bacterium]|nr:hypothetical protein [Myxococcales bacterium]